MDAKAKELRKYLSDCGFKTMPMGFSKSDVALYIYNLKLKNEKLQNEIKNSGSVSSAELESRLEAQKKELDAKRTYEIAEIEKKLDAEKKHADELLEKIERLESELDFKEGELNRLKGEPVASKKPSPAKKSAEKAEKSDTVKTNKKTSPEGGYDIDRAKAELADAMKGFALDETAMPPLSSAGGKDFDENNTGVNLMLSENRGSVGGEDIISVKNPAIVEKGSDLVANDPLKKDKGGDLGGEIYDMPIDGSHGGDIEDYGFDAQRAKLLTDPTELISAASTASSNSAAKIPADDDFESLLISSAGGEDKD